MKLDDRNRMIQELVDNMNTWDHETLLGWAKDRMHDILDGMNDTLLQGEYDNFGPEKDE